MNGPHLWVTDVSLPKRLGYRWVLANVLGEALAFATLATVVSTMIVAGGDLGGEAAKRMVLAGLFSGGILGGIVRGAAQWQALQQWAPLLSRVRWISVTSLGTALCWIIGLYVAGHVPPPASPILPGHINFLMLGSGVIAAGLGLGGLLGAVQGWTLAPYGVRAMLWVPANAGGWAIGFALVFASAVVLPMEGGSPQVVVMSALVGSVAGAVVGLITGNVLKRLVLPRETA